MNALETYQMFRALQLHFKGTNYDYIKYQGKVKVDPDKFSTRRDRFVYEKILRKHQGKRDDIEQFFVANLQENPSVWVGTLTNPEAMKLYKEWRSYQESISYHFKTEMEEIASSMPESMTPNGMLMVTDGEHPFLLDKFYEGIVSPCAMIQMNMAMKFFPYWDKNIDDDLLWPDTRDKLNRLTPFVNANLEKTKMVLADVFSSAK
jgi:hypothetical protein